MGFSSFFRRKPATRSPALPSPADGSQHGILSPERVAELEVAWAGLAAAAEASELTGFRACTRTGRPWAEDPAAVRAVAATLRQFPATQDRTPN